MIVKELSHALCYIRDAVAHSQRVTVKFMGGNWIITVSAQHKKQYFV